MSNILSITYDNAIAVTPSDATNDPAAPFAGFYSGSGGTIKVNTIRNNDVTLTNVPAGTVVTLAIHRVWSTGTTATGILGMVAMPFKRTAKS